MIKYHPLKTEFTHKGFKLSQIKRVGDVAIFKHFKSKKNLTFEVILVKRHDGYEIDGNKIEASEMYPSTSHWGSSGWSFKNLEIAEEKFQKLLKSEERKQKAESKRIEEEKLATKQLCKQKKKKY